MSDEKAEVGIVAPGTVALSVLLLLIPFGLVMYYVLPAKKGLTRW